MPSIESYCQLWCWRRRRRCSFAPLVSLSSPQTARWSSTWRPPPVGRRRRPHQGKYISQLVPGPAPEDPILQNSEIIFQIPFSDNFEQNVLEGGGTLIFNDTQSLMYQVVTCHLKLKLCWITFCTNLPCKTSSWPQVDQILYKCLLPLQDLNQVYLMMLKIFPLYLVIVHPLTSSIQVDELTQKFGEPDSILEALTYDNERVVVLNRDGENDINLGPKVLIYL